MRKLILVTLLAAAAATAAPLPAPAETGVVPAYRITHAEQLAPGLIHRTLVRGRGVREVVNVARLAPGATVALRAVTAAPPRGPRLERTSSMCARVGCAIAVNGDFFSSATGDATGGVVSTAELLRSPNLRHHQLMIPPDEGRPSAGRLSWKGSLVPTDLRSLFLDGVNVSRNANAIVLYTPSFGHSTRTNRHGNELVLRVVRPAGPIRLGQTSLVRLESLRMARGDAVIPRDGAVLSGHGRGEKTLSALWSRVKAGKAAPEALLRVEAASDVRESVGGTPILVRGGKRWFADAARSFVRGRHPRTIVGWNSAGEIFLVAIDGRQRGYSEGMTLAEAADFMIRLGATDAINLDGGGSTTFVERGAVANRPSDRAVRRGGSTAIVHVPSRGDTVVGNVERPVANALAIVPKSGGVSLAVNPLAGSSLSLPEVIPSPPIEATDPASNPGASLPGLIALPRTRSGRMPFLFGAAFAALAAALLSIARPKLARIRLRA
jgi:hypothetical protein